MEYHYSFKITPLKGVAGDASEQQYQILAAFDLPELLSYKTLFDRYNSAPPPYFNGNLVDIAALIVEEYAPQLLDHLEFDEEGYWLDIYSDSNEIATQFVALVCPVYQNLSLLEQYAQKVANPSTS
ncbi:hypothetical protein [uncultured Hymenobacter sp.]|uniref:hypothetical protein n=1 Tax=uncultured Hymenobacter sp. TaxID=170016 RepID=UPI0035CA7F9C